MKHKRNPAELLLINPRRRRRKAAAKRRRSSAFQRVVQLVPRRQRRRGTLQSVRFHGHPANRSTFHAAGYARNPRRRRRNPAFLSRGFIAMLGQGAVGALGGVALDLAMKPLPLNLKVGPINHLVRGVGAVGLGLLASVLRIPGAGEVAKGAMAITVYNAARQYVTVPFGLGELTDSDLAAIGDGGYMPAAYGDDMGEVISLPSPNMSPSAVGGMGVVLEGVDAPEGDGFEY
jgi:hypothetical protein